MPLWDSSKASRCSSSVRSGLFSRCPGSHSWRAAPFREGRPGMGMGSTPPVRRRLVSQRLTVGTETEKVLAASSFGRSSSKTDYRVAGRGGGYAKASSGSNADAETGRRPLLVPPARLSGSLSQGLWATSMHLSGHSDPRGAEGAHEKARRPRRGDTGRRVR
jgi:hypothetical protein